MLAYVVVHIEVRAGLVRIQDTDFDHGFASRGFSKSRNILQRRLAGSGYGAAADPAGARESLAP